MDTRRYLDPRGLRQIELGLSCEIGWSVLFQKNGRECEGGEFHSLLSDEMPLCIVGGCRWCLSGNRLSFQLDNKSPQLFPSSLAPGLSSSYCQLQSFCCFLQRETLQIT